VHRGRQAERGRACPRHGHIATATDATAESASARAGSPSATEAATAGSRSGAAATTAAADLADLIDAPDRCMGRAHAWTWGRSLSMSAPSLSAIESELEARMLELEARSGGEADPVICGELARVRTALQWCRAGVYGRCAVCGVPLPDRVLLHDPADMRCAVCRRLHASEEARPKNAVASAKMPLLSLEDVEKLNESFVRIAALARDPCAD
jgi:RNA polymerase-binding transcription factor DksA